MSTKHEIIIRLVKTAHLFMTVFLFVMAWRWYERINTIMIAPRYDVFVYGMFAALMFFFCRTYNAYLIEYCDTGEIVFSLFLSVFLSTAAVYAVTLLAWNKFYRPGPFLLYILLETLFSFLWAGFSQKLYFRLSRPLSSLVIYRNQRDLNRLSEIGRFEKKFRLDAQLKDPKDIGEAIRKIDACGAEAVFMTGVNATLRNGIVKYCIEKNIPGFFIPHVGDVILSGGQHIQAFSVPLMSIQRNSNPPEYLLAKRLFDILVSSLAIVITSPLMLLIALSVRLYDGGPALYRQVRLTKDRKEFQILKFRSMRVDAEKDGVARLSSGAADDRITPVGRVIRAARLDELPQLFNILRGDMTLVGPRPERPELAESYEKLMPAFSLRLTVKAGLTGYAQVYGKYNTDPYDKLDMDLMYIKRMNILLDIRIMFATLRILFMKESTEGVEKGRTDAIKEEF